MIRNRKIIVITGGIATGKTAFCKILENRGYPVLYSDKIAHENYQKHGKSYEGILREFGEGVLDDNGDIDRKKLGDIVFKDSRRLKTLEKITHGDIIDNILQKIMDYQGTSDIIFVEIPLYFEVKDDITNIITVDEVILICSKEETRIQRLMKREGISRESAIGRINLQMNQEIKKKLAHVIIDNDGDLQDLEKELDKYLHRR